MKACTNVKYDDKQFYQLVVYRNGCTPSEHFRKSAEHFHVVDVQSDATIKGFVYEICCPPDLQKYKASPLSMTRF